MCEDIGCDDQAEAEYMTDTFLKQYTKNFPGYNCTAVFCKGNDHVCKCKEQRLCEDIGCEDQKEGRCMTKDEYDKYMTDSKECNCSDDSAPITITNTTIHADKLFSNAYNIFLLNQTIERSPSIKSSCTNMINNHENSVQVIEREDVNGVVIDPLVKSQMLVDTVITSPPTLFSPSDSLKKRRIIVYQL